MRPLGKTYLIEILENKEEILEGGIILPKEDNKKLVHYSGKIIALGLGFDSSKDNIVNINDEVFFDWKQKEGKVKLLFNQKIFYIVEESLILALKEKEKND